MDLRTFSTDQLLTIDEFVGSRLQVHMVIIGTLIQSLHLPHLRLDQQLELLGHRVVLFAHA